MSAELYFSSMVGHPAHDTSTAAVRLIGSLDIYIYIYLYIYIKSKIIAKRKIKNKHVCEGFDGGRGCKQIVGTNPVLQGRR